MHIRINLKRLWRNHVPLLVGLILLPIPDIGRAAAINGSSSSYALSIDLTATRSLAIGAGPAPSSSGTAPDIYRETDSAASLSVSTKPLTLKTSLLETNAASDIDGSTGSKSAGADATVNKLDLQISALLGSLGLSVGMVQSTASVSGDFGALTATGVTALTRAGLSAGLLSATLDINPAANTRVDVLGLLGLTGVSLILNEQTFYGEGITSLGVAVNAIHLGFNNFVSGLNLISGDIIIAHSEALIQVQKDTVNVPEPGTLILALLVLPALLRSGRRRSATFSAMR